jgi:hypothetical protein
MEIKKVNGFKIHYFDSFDDYKNNYNSKFSSLKDVYRIKNVKVKSLVNKTTAEGDHYFLLLKSGDKQIKGLARVAVKKDFLDNKWETCPSDIVRAKEGDEITVGGYYYELNTALKGKEIPLRFLKT